MIQKLRKDNIKFILVFLLIPMITFSGCVKSIPGSSGLSGGKSALGVLSDVSEVLPGTEETGHTGESVYMTEEDPAGNNSDPGQNSNKNQHSDLGSDSTVDVNKKGDNNPNQSENEDSGNAGNENPGNTDQDSNAGNNGNGNADPNSNAGEEPEDLQNKVSIQIKGYKDEIILENTTVDIKDGDTVFSVLKNVCEKNNIELDYRDSETKAYVKGIDNLYEFDKGNGSGWIYAVNGKTPGVGCGKYKIKSGDEIQWGYSLNGGKDLGFLKG